MGNPRVATSWQSRVFRTYWAIFLGLSFSLSSIGKADDYAQCLVSGMQASPVEAAHAAITEDLFNGHVVESYQFSENGNKTELFKLDLYNDHTGRKRTAIFKPRTWGDNEGWGRAPVEYVAYRLNRLLGMDYVAPVAYRRNFQAHFHTWAEGALIYFVPGARIVTPASNIFKHARVDLFMSDTRILDVLIQNSDRHAANLMQGKHWTDGKTAPVLIDQAAGFRPGASVKMDQDNAFQTGPVKVIRTSTWLGLKNLDSRQLTNEFKDFLSQREIQDVLSRRDGILKYIDGLVHEHGRANVVVADDKHLE